MGGAIRTVVRYADGQVASCATSTIVIQGLQNSDRFLARDEGYVRSLLEEWVEDLDDEEAAQDSPLAPCGDGILVVDFVNLTVVDCNYHSPFGTTAEAPAHLLEGQLSSLDARDGLERLARMLAERKVSIERIPYADGGEILSEVLACDFPGLGDAVKAHYARVPYVDTGYARFAYDLSPWKVIHAKEWEVLPALERLGFTVNGSVRNG